MKRFIFCVIVIALLSSCAGNTGERILRNKNDKISVVATVFPPYDFARQVGGDLIDVSMLLPPASESHSYEPTPLDIISVRNCDVFIYIGGESDEWVKDVLNSVDKSKMKIITLMDCVEVSEEETVEGMQGEEKSENEAREYDEHIWTSPKNAELIARKIADTFISVDSANADVYVKNTETYSAKLDELDLKFKEIVSGAERKVIVFGDRFPFRYFADAYGLKYFAAFPGCSAETEASVTTVKFLIDKIKVENIPVVFHIELGNENMAKTISEATGAKKLLLHSCHNISKDDFLSGVTYIDLMSRNAEALKEALK